MKTLLVLLLCAFSLAGALRAQYLTHNFNANPANGEQLYKSACVACHGDDGKGAPQTISAFERPDTFPDFTRCDQTTSEVDAGYKAVITNGGPNRGFSQIMPAFGEALSSQEIDDLVAYLRSFCRDPHWPRGELNLPRAIVTEKAYPEDEVVLSTAVNVRGTPQNQTHIIHEQRFGVKNQIELDLPFMSAVQNHTWYGGVGDATVALKRVLFSNLNTGSIFSAQGGFLLPLGSRTRGFGAGTTQFEPFLAYDQLFRTDTFIQLQAGADVPFNTRVAPNTVFFNSAIGQSFAGNHRLGRLWTPMVEFLASRDYAPGARTEWDILPQAQVTLSKRQHVRADLGLRVPFTNTAGRDTQLVFYILWDWGDGKLTEGW
jgi:cytochrome c553